jgi:hypothetical protein
MLSVNSGNLFVRKISIRPSCVSYWLICINASFYGIFLSMINTIKNSFGLLGLLLAIFSCVNLAFFGPDSGHSLYSLVKLTVYIVAGFYLFWLYWLKPRFLAKKQKDVVS